METRHTMLGEPCAMESQLLGEFHLSNHSLVPVTPGAREFFVVIWDVQSQTREYVFPTLAISQRA